jgi:hypothetical protein
MYYLEALLLVGTGRIIMLWDRFAATDIYRILREMQCRFSNFGANELVVFYSSTKLNLVVLET